MKKGLDGLKKYCFVRDQIKYIKLVLNLRKLVWKILKNQIKTLI